MTTAPKANSSRRPSVAFKQAAEKRGFVSGHDFRGCGKIALSEGYGLQAVHNSGVMNPALAAEGRYSFRNRTFSAASSAGP